MTDIMQNSYYTNNQIQNSSLLYLSQTHTSSCKAIWYSRILTFLFMYSLVCMYEFICVVVAFSRLFIWNKIQINIQSQISIDNKHWHMIILIKLYMYVCCQSVYTTPGRWMVEWLQFWKSLVVDFLWLLNQQGFKGVNYQNQVIDQLSSNLVPLQF